jgi:hypothetical protein
MCYLVQPHSAEGHLAAAFDIDWHDADPYGSGLNILMVDMAPRCKASKGLYGLT